MSDDVKPYSAEELNALKRDKRPLTPMPDADRYVDVVALTRSDFDRLLLTARSGLEDRERLDAARSPTVSSEAPPPTAPTSDDMMTWSGPRHVFDALLRDRERLDWLNEFESPRCIQVAADPDTDDWRVAIDARKKDQTLLPARSGRASLDRETK